MYSVAPELVLELCGVLELVQMYSVAPELDPLSVMHQGRLALGRPLRSLSICMRLASDDRASSPSLSPVELLQSHWQEGWQRRRGLNLASWYAQ